MASNFSNLGACFLLFTFISLATSSPNTTYECFMECFTLHIPPTTNVYSLLLTPDSTLYSTLLSSFIQNLRFTSPSTPKPLLIVAPLCESHVQASVICSKALSLPIRVRSGGHDYEGLSYRSFKHSPFILLDMSNLRSITIDTKNAIAWVQAGATVGELAYNIAQKSPILGFPVGDCISIAVGGFISGGGFGSLARKYGLAADNVLDVKVVDAYGRLLEGEGISEDLLWAIRGGGGSSFGVIVSWKVKLVRVPQIVTVFTLRKRSIELVDRWQRIAYELDDNLFIKLSIQPAFSVFTALYLGDCSELLQQMAVGFPELGLKRSDCKELSWVQSVLYFAGYTNGEPVEVLKDRSRGAQPKVYNKAKSDYVGDLIPEAMLQSICERVSEDNAGVVYLYPQGGRMDEIDESATPYPHRQGSRYLIQYLVKWEEGGGEELGWIRRLYKEMTPYVSKNPRAAYLNFRDLDLGRNVEGDEGNYSKSKVWGRRYFKGNFARLAKVKGEVDPENFFRFEQSIPPVLNCKKK